FQGTVDRDALALYARHSYVPGPWSIYKEARKLPPASLMRVSAGADGLQMEAPAAYWSARAFYDRATPRAGIPDEEAIEQLDVLLRDAVRTRMIADVPLGAFLSGGIDSSLVVALMQAQSNRRIDTYTIGFNEDVY